MITALYFDILTLGLLMHILIIEDQQKTALFLAKEGIEIIRAYRDGLWDNGKDFDLEGYYVVGSSKIEKISLD